MAVESLLQALERRLTLKGTIFTTTQHDMEGGIALEEDAYGWVYDNLIQNNLVTTTAAGEIKGGGIYISQSGAWINDNQIISNTAINDFSSPAYGGGISLWQADLVDIIENELRGNSTLGEGDRGGVFISINQVKLRFNVTASPRTTPTQEAAGSGSIIYRLARRHGSKVTG